MLRELLDSRGFSQHYDYIYLPIRLKTMANLGGGRASASPSYAVYLMRPGRSAMSVDVRGLAGITVASTDLLNWGT